jgi:hypothetical protein
MAAGGVAVAAGSGAAGVRGAVQAASAIKMSVKTKILFIFPSFCGIFAIRSRGLVCFSAAVGVFHSRVP